MKSTAAAATAREATVVVVMGGRSSERAVSLRSGASVAAALAETHDGRGPARVVELEITASGAWRFGGEEHAPEDALARLPRDAVYFLALHGGEGEDGTVQGLLAATGRAHSGSGVAASALCLCKSWTRSVLSEAGLAVAPGRTIDAAQWAADRAGVLASARALSRAGWAVKPDRGGSSVATSVLDDAEELGGAIEAALATGDRALVEARVRGVECTVGVLGNRGAALRALTPVEIVPKDGRFFDYDEKYSATGAAEHCPPRSIDAATCARLRALAERAHAAAACDGYSRTDFIVPPEGEPVVLEINTLPGMTSRSLLPLAAADAGMSFRALCLRLVELALERGSAR